MFAVISVHYHKDGAKAYGLKKAEVGVTTVDLKKIEYIFSKKQVLDLVKSLHEKYPNEYQLGIISNEPIYIIWNRKINEVVGLNKKRQGIAAAYSFWTPCFAHPFESKEEAEKFASRFKNVCKDLEVTQWFTRK